MKKKDIENKVYEMIQPTSKKMKVELVDVEYVKEGPYKYLRVYIDKADGVSIDDCQDFSKAINDKIDDFDPIDSNYFLEVSSPGIDRPFKRDEDFKRALNNDVEVKLYKAIKNSKKLIGELMDFDEEKILLKIDDEVITISRKNIVKINNAIKF